MSFPKSPLPDTNLNSWLSRLIDAAERLEPRNSDSVTARNTSAGTVFEVNDNVLPLKNQMKWMEAYNDTSSYSIGAVAYVTTGSSYSGSLGTFQSVPGVYVCISGVPAFFSASTFSGSSYSSYLQQYYNASGRLSGVIYAPIYPYASTTPAYQTSDGNGQYWYLISGAGGSSGYCQMAFISMNGTNTDCINCYTYDPVSNTSGSVSTVVLLPPELRPSLHAKDQFGGSFGSASYAYTMSGQSRVATFAGGASTETQLITPMFLAGEILEAMQTTTGISVSGTSVGYQLLPGREWAWDPNA